MKLVKTFAATALIGALAACQPVAPPSEEVTNTAVGAALGASAAALTGANRTETALAATTGGALGYIYANEN